MSLRATFSPTPLTYPDGHRSGPLAAEQLGPRVLAAPPTRGFDLLDWIVPFVMLVGSGVAVGGVAWRWTRLSEEPADAAAEVQDRIEFDPALKRRLDDELLDA